MTLHQPSEFERNRGVEFFARILGPSEVQQLVASYFTVHTEGQQRKFAGATFDLIGRTEGQDRPEEVTLSDLLAVSLLDEPFRAAAIRGLIEPGDTRDRVSRGFADLPVSLHLASADMNLLEKADKLFEAIAAIHDVGPTRASKLLARKRPHLIPIWDGIVEEFLRPEKYEHWLLMSAIVQNSLLSALLTHSRGRRPRFGPRASRSCVARFERRGSFGPAAARCGRLDARLKGCFCSGSPKRGRAHRRGPARDAAAGGLVSRLSPLASTSDLVSLRGVVQRD